jgi:hypothetical protein
VRCIGTRIILATALVAIALLWQADSAFAKILPVTSIEVTTVQPTVGHRVDVVVRFAPNFNLGDAAWENHEVSVIPTSKADARGWLLDRTDRGTPVPLRRIGKGVFRGTFVMRQAGDYVVFAWSSVYARQDRLHGVVTKGQYATPVWLRIDGNASIASQPVARAAAHKSSPTSLALWIAASVMAIGIAAWLAIRRVRSHGARRTWRASHLRA